MKKPAFSSVLGNRDFLFLWLSQFTCQMADRMFSYVLIILAFDLTHSNLGVSVPMLAFGLAAIIFGPLAGVFVDRWPKKNIMISSNILRGLLILVFPFVQLFSHSLLNIFVFCFLIFTIAQFFIPAENSSIPELVPGSDLILANSLFMGMWMFSSIIGFGLAAPLVNFTGEVGTYAVVTGLYFLSALFILTIPVRKKFAAETNSFRSVVKELKNGLSFVMRHLVVTFSLIKLFIATAALAAISVLALGYSEAILKIGSRNFGYLVLSAGAGMIMGIYFIGHFSPWFKHSRLILFGFLVAGFSLVFLSAISNIYLTLLLIFLLGFGNALVTAPLQTVIHENTPENLRGRVSGILGMLVNSAFTFPAVAGGWFADIFGLRVTILALGLFLLGGGLLNFLPEWFREV
jgi:MFS family permease